jgi:hypothetical protein
VADHHSSTGGEGLIPPCDPIVPKSGTVTAKTPLKAAIVPNFGTVAAFGQPLQNSYLYTDVTLVLANTWAKKKKNNLYE